MVVLSSYGVIRIRKKVLKNTCYKYFAIFSFGLLQSSRFNLRVYFILICQTPVVEIPSFNQNEKVTCDNCGTQTTKLNFARHKKELFC